MMQWRRKPDNYAVVEVMSSVVAIFMVLSIITAIMLWGVPFSQEIEDRAVNENIKSKLFAAANSIEDVTHDAVGTRRSFLFSTQSGSISIDDVGDRFIVMYSLGNHEESSGYDFVVSGLDVDDTDQKDFTLTFSGYTPAQTDLEAKVYWFPDESWWDPDWQYRTEITINHDKVEGDLENFPVLISFTDDSLKDVAQSDGEDIVFIDEDGIQLNHEIESFDKNTGELVAWVKIPSLSSTEDTILYLYYGNSGCASQESPEDVWDEDYVMVQHLEEQTGDALEDSTDDDNDGTKQGDAALTTSGKIDGAYIFDGAGDYISISEQGLVSSEDSFTISLWFKTSASGLALYGEGNAESSDDYVFIYQSVKNIGVCNYASGSGLHFFNDVTANNKEWHHVVYVKRSSASYELLHNGVSVETDFTDVGKPTVNCVSIGDVNVGGTHLYFTGLIDEVRISNIDRSEEWIETSYNTMNDPASFFSIGPQSEKIDDPVQSVNDYTFTANEELSGTVRIDLYDDTDGDGLDSEDLFGRVFLFDLGLIKHKYSSILGTYDTILENDGILTAVSDIVSVKKAPKVISEENLLMFRIVQMRHLDGQATGGSGTLRFTSVLTSNFVREMLSGVYNVRVQFSGPFAGNWFEYFKRSEPFGYGFIECTEGSYMLEPPLEGAEDVIVEFDAGSGVATPTAGDVGGLYAFDCDDGYKDYTFIDNDKDWFYTIGDIVLNVNPDGEGDDADPSPGDPGDPTYPVNCDPGGLWTFDTSGTNEPFIFQDTSEPYWAYTDAVDNNGNSNQFYIDYPYYLDPDGEGDDADVTISDGVLGGLYALNKDDNPYTFQDINGDWSFGARLIISQSLCQIGFG